MYCTCVTKLKLVIRYKNNIMKGKVNSLFSLNEMQCVIVLQCIACINNELKGYTWSIIAGIISE